MQHLLLEEGIMAGSYVTFGCRPDLLDFLGDQQGDKRLRHALAILW
jgi:hypothetical protein